MRTEQLEKALSKLRKIDRAFTLTREKVASDNSHGVRMIARWLKRELPPRAHLQDIGLSDLIEMYSLDLDVTDEETPTVAEVFTALVYANYQYRVSREGQVSVGIAGTDLERVTYNCYGMYNGEVVSPLPIEKVSKEAWPFRRIRLQAESVARV